MISSEVGEYRLKRVLSQLDDMATMSPRSPILSQAVYNPVEYLPVTRFPQQSHDELFDLIHDAAVETKKEREVILNQPYRTTPLITPGAKARPDLKNNKLPGKPLKPTIYRPLEPKSVVATLDENRALVNRQFNSPKSLYSNQNVAEAVYEQTGVKFLRPHPPKQFNAETSPTFQALLADESYGPPAQLLPAAHVQQAVPPPRFAHSTAPTAHVNSIGQPSARIAQSDSFRRLMMSVMMSD